VLATEEVAAAAGKGSLGSTFGGGPLACAMIVATLDAIEEGELLPRVRAVSAYARRRLITGPVESIQGAGLLLGLRTTRPAKAVVAELLARDVLAGSSGDPHVLRILPPLVLTPEHVDVLAAALAELPG
jgi:acetylornithine/succinyldiaminopimelate/putrescine aminotransferase